MLCEPKMPYSQYTQNPATATTTTTTTSSIHPRVSRRPIEILLTRKPFANRKMVRLERSSLLRFEREPTATPGTVRYRTGRDKRYRMGAPRAGAPTTRNGCETAKRRRSNVVPRGVSVRRRFGYRLFTANEWEMTGMAAV